MSDAVDGGAHEAPAEATPLAAPAEVTVRAFAEEKALQEWQVRALCARHGLQIHSARPLAELEALLDVALHGSI